MAEQDFEKYGGLPSHGTVIRDRAVHCSPVPRNSGNRELPLPSLPGLPDGRQAYSGPSRKLFTSLFKNRSSLCPVFGQISILLLFIFSFSFSHSQVTPEDSTSGKGRIKIMKPDTVRPEPIVTKTDTPVTDTNKKGRALVLFFKGDPDKPHDPNISVRRSLMLPGWGQAYNHKYWKIPIVYAGFAVTGYLIATNHTQYKLYQDIARCKQDETCNDTLFYPDYVNYPASSMISERDYYRRTRDLNIIFTVLWYAIQAVDAYVDGHLMNFNVSDDLSMRIDPGIHFNPYVRNNMYMGATITLKLRQ